MLRLERMPTFDVAPPSDASVKSRVEILQTPATVFGWLPWWWRGVLFPGSSEGPSPWQWLPLVQLALLSSVLLLPWTNFYLFEPDEGRYAQIPREMLERGDWIVPTLQGEPYLDKPPLFYWAVMLAYSIFGYQDWAARFVPALAVQLTVLVTYLLGRRMVGERSAWWGSLSLLLLPGLIGSGRLLLLDGMLTFFVATSQWAAYLATRGPKLHRGWWILCAVACGLGVLTKGPIALVLLVPPLWLQGKLCGLRSQISRRGWLGLGLVVLAINLPWYAAVCIQLPEFAGHFLWEHNVLRFAQPFDHLEPIWYFGPVMFVGLFPAVLLAVPFWRFMTSTSDAIARRRDPALSYLLLAGAWCVFFFSLSGSKLPTYILPAFPLLCLALGVFLARTDWHQARSVRIAVVGLVAFILIGHAWLGPAIAWQRSPMNTPPEVIEWCRDRATPVFCFSRNVDSIAFYTGRSDFRSFRSKELAGLIVELDLHPRSVVLFAHRNSQETLRLHLPPHLRISESRKLGLCDAALVERHLRP